MLGKNPVFKEIKNWRLFAEKFGDGYDLHDAVIKRFDLNQDELTIVFNTVYAMGDGNVYDVAFKFTNLIFIESRLEMGTDYVGCIAIKKDERFKNLFRFTVDSAYAIIECFNIEVVSVTAAEPFTRGILCLENENVTPENATYLWRS